MLLDPTRPTSSPDRSSSAAGAGRPSSAPEAMAWQEALAAFPSALRYGINGYIEEAIRRKGEVAAANLGPFPAVFVSRPDLIRHVLVTHKDVYRKENPLFELLRPLAGNGVFLSDGEFWRSQRRILQPEFTSRGVDERVAGMAHVASAVADEWELARLAGRTVDATESMRDAAMRIICQTVLNLDLGPDAARLGQALDRLLALLQLQMIVPGPLGQATWLAIERPMRATVATIDAFVEGVIERNRRDGTDGLVNRLLVAPDPESGRTMTAKHLRDEIVTLFIAGHETTATTLAWAWVELCRSPDALARLQAEADEVLGDRLPCAEDLPKLAYARAVFDEAMRLYPPLPFVPRLTSRADVIAGRYVPAGTTIVCSIFALHRRPDLWAAPLAFDPERFLPDRRKSIEPGAFAPFGAGPRMCMGNHFALAEGAVMLSTLARRFDVMRAHQDVGITKLPGSLRPDRPLRLRLAARSVA